MQYKQVFIYYFSGTGNARQAALWIKNRAEENNVPVQIIQIKKGLELQEPDFTEKTLVGFCSPTHGFNMPPLVLKFLRRYPKAKNVDAFILNTRGGLKMGKLFIPGLSGLAQLLPAFMLKLKGYRIVGMQPLDLPSNWIFFHPGLKQKVVDSIFARCHKITNRFAENILQGKRKYKALLSLPFDIWLIPITIGYYFIGRFFLAKTLIATDACDNCNICVNTCPVKAIKIIDNRPFWTYRCESCMHCINICPQRAIETTHGYSALIVLIASVVISPIMLTGLQKIGLYDFLFQSGLTEKGWTIISSVFFLIFAFISYGILHVLLKNKFINKLVAYTSLSKYKFWRRYKAPR